MKKGLRKFRSPFFLASRDQAFNTRIGVPAAQAFTA